MKSEGDYFLAGKLWQTYTVCWKAETLSLPKKGPYSQGYGLPSGHAQLWELDHKDGRAPKNWCLRTVVLEKTPESPLDRKEIKLVNLKGNQSWILIEGLMLKLKLQYFGHLMQTANSLEKSLRLGKTESRRSVSEDEMAGRHHWCNGHGLGQISEDGEGQGGGLQSLGSQRAGYNNILK